MVKGRLAALMSVIAMVGLSSGAAALSLSTSSAYQSPAAQLTQAVQATLASQSFTIKVTSSAMGTRFVETIVFEAPNRYEDTFFSDQSPVTPGPYFTQSIVVGKTEYLKIGDGSWNVTTQPMSQSDGADLVSSLLPPLPYSAEGTTTTIRSGGTFRFYSGSYVLQRVFQRPETYTSVATLVVSGGKMMSEDIVTSIVDASARHRAPYVVLRAHVSIGAFGASRVVAPSVQELTHRLSTPDAFSSSLTLW